MSKCPHCGSEILWGLLEDGTTRVMLSLPPTRGYMYLLPAPENLVRYVETYAPHYADCQNIKKSA